MAFGSGDLHLPTLMKNFSEWKALPSPQSEQYLNERVAPSIKPLFDIASRVKLPAPSLILGAAHQLMNLKWEQALGPLPSLESALSTLFSAAQTDSSAADRAVGICPLPLYEFNERDWELLLMGRRVGEVRERLKELGIYQYFFPAPDHLLLGIADRQVSANGNLVEVAERVPTLGHPIGPPELFPDAKSLVDVLDALKGSGYVAEAEIGVAITASGREVRQQVKVMPREGLIYKISRLFSAKVDISLKDLFR